ncbi:methyltransferase domain-containing protein [Dyadobacter subterraneus]|uniref:Methyltransferase domain-containing protein n=1 Tax=Dyadobacter subterraneus TaxID=2773304 RepID=A0ABR9WAJ9_9BACT|nr:methyltransferase domain-containing protein [Dyadobacter subterraneus]MBE9462506.1 methyltransferase domain-containing protein [Dyadobacter subterraneus]
MFKFRSTEKELLDQEEIPEDDLFQNLRELDFVNHWLGGYNISFSALKTIVKPGHRYSFVDIGCGGGDTLKHIKKWRTKQGYSIDLHGVDLKPVCIKYAESNPENTGIRFLCDDYKNIYKHIEKIDIIHACLFCHHLTESELLELIGFAVENKSILIINDLERNPLAYYSIKLLTSLFSKSYLVKNDAPLSVLRGFKRKEWISILEQSRASHYSVKNKWAFRHQIIMDGTRE